jgi:hypothetical protein
MTHASNVSIPARFIFRPFGVQWEIVSVKIIGWHIEPHASSGFSRLQALSNLREESVVIRVAIPRVEDNFTLLSRMLNDPREWERKFDFYDVQLERNEIPLDCLQPHENPETAPDIAGREFDLLICPFREAYGSIQEPQPEQSVRDAWEMRSQFFSLHNDFHSARQFLNRWGLWSFKRLYKLGTLNMLPFVVVPPHRLWQQRDSYLKSAAGTARAWLSSATPLSFKQSEKRPYFIVERHFCKDAIEATLTIDHLAQVKFGICKRHDCRKLFKRTTAQKRLYCGPKCAHLANVRKLRATKAKEKGTKKNAKS